MNYAEMNRISADPAAINALAKMIINTLDTDLSDGAHALLEQFEKYDGTWPLTTRQKEVLFSLRERASRKPKAGPYTASSLIQKAFELRYDLVNYENEEWIEELQKMGSGIALSNGQWRRLFVICRELDLIYKDEWVPL